MARFRAAYTALVALQFAAACGKDSSSSELVAPEASVGAAASSASNSDGDSDGFFSRRPRVALRDDCDPKDAGWNVVGGCALRSGDVTFAEFNGELDSPLAAAVVGHQSWRNDPSYLVIEMGKTVRVRNEGGRPHTFTSVAAFGGGKVPPLTEGLVIAPECPGSIDIPPGGSTRVSGLAVGNHRFQCCIHPWMRALIKVKADADD